MTLFVLEHLDLIFLNNRGVHIGLAAKASMSDHFRHGFNGSVLGLHIRNEISAEGRPLVLVLPSIDRRGLVILAS